MNEIWEMTVQFHGHTCPGVAVGYRAALYASRLLGMAGERIDGSHLVISHNGVCGLDGIQVVTGCTFGNDGLHLDDMGKQAFSFLSKKSGKGIRLTLAVPLWLSDEPLQLHRKVREGIADEEEKQAFFGMRQARGLEMLDYSDEEMFSVREVSHELRNRARLHPSVKCASCDEDTMIPWLVDKDGRKLCLECAAG